MTYDEKSVLKFEEKILGEKEKKKNFSLSNFCHFSK